MEIIATKSIEEAFSPSGAEVAQAVAEESPEDLPIPTYDIEGLKKEAQEREAHINEIKNTVCQECDNLNHPVPLYQQLAG